MVTISWFSSLWCIFTIGKKPSHFEELKIKDKVTSHFIDIRNFENFNKVIDDISPDFIFHLAAQALVGKAYENSLLTYQTNFMGTLNLLKVLKNKNVL